jgi:hypothetical protein
MAKLELTFVDLTDTVDSTGKSLDKVSITMTTGEDQKEGFCFFNVPYKCTTITEDTEDEMAPPKKETQEGTGPVSFAFNIQNARFEKKMYSPNEIYAVIQIAPGTKEKGDPNVTKTYDNTSIPKDDLEKSFINKQVILKCDDLEVCSDYYVQEINPTYKKGVMYVTFKMYSPDYQLTQEEYCRTFVSKKLGLEVLTGEIKNYKLPYNSKNMVIDYANMKHIKLAKADSDGNKAGEEHIFPYLVQYNESFYDFLKRTTNRWGEFLYYEDKKLLMGYGYAADNKTDYKGVASSVTYKDLTVYKTKQENAGQYYSEAPIDSQILKNDLTQDEYDVVKTRMNSIIPSNYKKLDGDIYVVKKLAGFLNNDKTIWQFLVDTGVDDVLDMVKANKVSDDKNDQFNNDYFVKKNRTETKFNDVQFNGKKFNQFSEYKPFLNTDEYIKIVAKEFASGRNAIELDFDTTYPGIKLGQIITYDKKQYLVVKVEGYQPEKLVIVDDDYVEMRVEMTKVCYKVTAVPQSRVESDDTTYYPPVIPEGHVRRSGPQLATVTEGTKEDPLRYNRVRIKYDWQSKEEWSSPWLQFTPGGGKSRSGVYSWHLKGQRVLVDYIAGNIERPYVVGSVVGSEDFKMPAQMKTYQQVFQTPWEQKILMTDGAGAGATAMLASFNPGLKLLQGFWPTAQLPGLDFDTSQNLEGNIELTDKYGFYSIKGSTNDRNVTIKSPWGDVKINAFTGITISAPNGDVKIKGKNVSIEAGCNLTLASGKNIKQKFLMDGELCDIGWATLGTTVTKAVTSKIVSTVVSLTDISLLRNILEVMFKPVEGKIQITSGRYLMLEAGKKEVSYPIDAYWDLFKGLKSADDSDIILCAESFEKVKGIVDEAFNNQQQFYTVAKTKKARLEQLIAACVNNDGVEQCKQLDDVLTALWNNPKQDPKALMDFQGLYRDVKEDDQPDYRIISHFLRVNAHVIADVASPENVRNYWKSAIKKQQSKRNEIINTVIVLASMISYLKDLELRKAAENYKDLNAVLTMANLPDDCLLKTLKNDDNYKNFAADYQLGVNAKKQAYRKIFIALVNKFKLERSAMEGGGMLTQPTVFAEPAYDCDDIAWGKYVKSILTLRKKSDNNDPWWKKAGKAAGKAFLDPIKNTAFDVKGIINALDDWTYGPSKKGEILFATSDGTMVLDKNIYRANVGGLDLNRDSGNPNDPQGNGPATRVRNAMLG